MSELVGYKLLDADSNVVQSWGGIWGQCPSIPNALYLPTGEIVTPPSLNEAYGSGNFTLVQWLMDPPDPTSQDVNAERDRRTALPLSVTINGTTFIVDMDDQSLRNLQGLVSGAILNSVMNVTTPRDFITHDNTIVSLTPADFIALGQAVDTRISTLFLKGRAMKDAAEANGTPIPSNYTDDSFWE